MFILVIVVNVPCNPAIFIRPCVESELKQNWFFWFVCCLFCFFHTSHKMNQKQNKMCFVLKTSLNSSLTCRSEVHFSSPVHFSPGRILNMLVGSIPALLWEGMRTMDDPSLCCKEKSQGSLVLILAEPGRYFIRSLCGFLVVLLSHCQMWVFATSKLFRLWLSGQISSVPWCSSGRWAWDCLSQTQQSWGGPCWGREQQAGVCIYYKFCVISHFVSRWFSPSLMVKKLKL